VNPVTLSTIGLAMGLFGGMLGIGGSLIMIPALVFFYGENQHLYQASSMICNFCVASASLLAHRKARTLVPEVLWRMIPMAVAGIVAGVALSNIPFFAGKNSYLLARLFGGYLAAVAIYNAARMSRRPAPSSNVSNPGAYQTPLLKKISSGIGLLTGLAAGLLGIGAGSVATPLQQFLLRLPLTQAMSNSASIIVGIAWIGAVYKTATLPQPGIAVSDSLKIAAWIIPTALLGGFVGGHLMHLLPRWVVRGLFIAVCLVGAWKLLTVSPAA
jgi:uncharacterized membrane protein YfcA